MVKELKNVEPQVSEEETEEEVPVAKGQFWYVLVAIVAIVGIIYLPIKFKEPTDVFDSKPAPTSSIPPLPNPMDENAQNPSESAVKPSEDSILPGPATAPPLFSGSSDKGK